MFTITFKESARKELYSLPIDIIKRITVSIDKLADNPRPAGAKKLKGKKENFLRIRIGDYRVVYVIDDGIRIVNIRRVGHRKNVYD